MRAGKQGSDDSGVHSRTAWNSGVDLRRRDLGYLVTRSAEASCQPAGGLRSAQERVHSTSDSTGCLATQSNHFRCANLTIYMDENSVSGRPPSVLSKPHDCACRVVPPSELRNESVDECRKKVLSFIPAGWTWFRGRRPGGVTRIYPTDTE